MVPLLLPLLHVMDLVHKVYVAFTTSGLTINGSDLVKEAELEIGGQRIDRHYQEWNDVWNSPQLQSKAIGLKAMHLVLVQVVQV